MLACRARFWLCSTPKACSCKALATASTAPSPPKHSTEEFMCLNHLSVESLLYIHRITYTDKIHKICKPNRDDCESWPCWNTVSIPNPAKGVPQRSQATKRIYYKAATAWFPERKSLSFQTKMCLLPKTLDSKLISVELETNSIYYFECSCFFVCLLSLFVSLHPKKKQRPCPQNRGSSSCKPVQRHGLPHQKSKLISLCLRNLRNFPYES